METGYRLSPDEIAEVKQLKKENLSNKEISRRMGKSCGAINNYFANLDSYEKNQSIDGKTGTKEIEKDSKESLKKFSKSSVLARSARKISETKGKSSASLKTVQINSKNSKKIQKEISIDKTKPPSKHDAERAAKMEQRKISKAKRAAKNKIISKKTKRGQPLMKDRIEFLLQKIQSSNN